MGRELIPKRLAPFYEPGFPSSSTSGISLRFQRLFPTSGQIVHVLLALSRLPLRAVPLACLIHAASVHSEPGSNSPSLSRIAAGTFIGSSQAPWRSLQALFPSHSSLSPKLLSKLAVRLSSRSRLVCHISGGSIEYLQSSKRLGLFSGFLKNS